MGKYDRGVYEPSDEVRAFDGAEDEDDVEGSRLPLLIVLALLVLAMFAGVVWLAYTQGVARGRGDTPVLTAAAGPERVAPPAAASGTVPYQGFKIYEQPAPPDDEVGDAPAKPAPVVAAPAAPKPAPVAAPASAPPKATAMVPPPAAKPAPAPASAPPKSVASLIQQSNSVPAAKPAPAPAKPAAAPPKPASAPPAARQVASVPPSVATGAPRQLGMAAAPPPAAPKTAAPLPPVAAAKPAGGGFVLQIGSYKSQADAEAAWRTYKGRHAALLSGYSENIQQADLGDRGTWYRLRIGGLADREVAGALCDRLKADGGACILGR
jgi:cell division septation protein DedD